MIAEKEEIEIDLYKQSIRAGSKTMYFVMDEYKKEALLKGLDEIGITLQLEQQISEYEKNKSRIFL